MNTTFTKKQHEDLEQCKKSLIISWKTRKNGKPPQINNYFFNWCKKTNQPYVQIKLNQTKADVFLDLPNKSGCLDQEGVAQFRKLLFDFGFPEQEINLPNPTGVSGLPHDKLTGFAPKLVQIGKDFCSRHKQE